MRKTHRRRWFGIAALGAGLLLAGTATAWYQIPGAGAMTYERQSMMRDHGYGMKELADMFSGRQIFDRAEAIRLARELEAGLGDNLARNFAPGAVVAGSRATPWTWRNFGALRGHAEASQQSAARLVEALEEGVSEQQVEPRRMGVRPRGMPPHRGGYGPWAHRRGGSVPVSMEAVQEFGRLNATCHACHVMFRGGRW